MGEKQYFLKVLDFWRELLNVYCKIKKILKSLSDGKKPGKIEERHLDYDPSINTQDHIERSRNMKKLFILHGWTYSLEKWQSFLEMAKKTGIEPIMLNIPGLTSKNDKIWNIENYVNWLKEIFNKEKGKVVLLGHSNGGRIAINFSLKYPEKVEKLILIDSAGIYHNELPLALKRVVFRILAKFGKKLTSSPVLKTAFYKLTRETDYKDATPNMKQTMLNMINSDKLLKPEKVQTPTLIFWGRDDKITPLSDGKLMHKLIKNSKLEIIENASHSPQFTHPNEVADLIVNNLTI